MGEPARFSPGARPAIRARSPHVIPRKPPTIVPPPLDTPPPEKIASRSNDGWPTSLLTIEVPAYQYVARGTPARAQRVPANNKNQSAQGQLALTCLTGAVALVSIALAAWQLLWLLESTDRGRALIDAGGAAIAWVGGIF